MGIEPPDPGNALNLAKTCTYDATTGGFRQPTTNETRWLWPESGRLWTATSTRERTVSQATYDLLRDGVQVPHGRPYFTAGSQVYGLFDDGFEAVAVAV